MAFSINDGLTSTENTLRTHITDNKKFCDDEHFKDWFLNSRVDSLGIAVTTTLGALFATFCIIPSAGLRLVGEILDIPTHMYEAWNSSKNYLKGFCGDGVFNTLARIGKLYLGATSSFVLGTIYPPANNSFHAKVIVPDTTNL